MRTLRPSLSIIALATVSACAPVGSSSRTEATRAAIAIEESPAALLRVAVLDDITLSGDATATPRVRRADLDPLIDAIIAAGGELAVGTISARSSAPLVRFYVAPPVAAPPAPDPNGPTFKVRARQKAHDSAMVAHRSLEQARLGHAAEDARRFRASVDSALAAPRDAHKTDLWRAMLAAARMLEEPLPRTSSYRSVLIAVTDGEDNQRAAEPVNFAGQILAVSSSGALGALKDLDVTRFESVPAAVRYLLDHPRGN